MFPSPPRWIACPLRDRLRGSPRRSFTTSARRAATLRCLCVGKPSTVHSTAPRALSLRVRTKVTALHALCARSAPLLLIASFRAGGRAFPWLSSATTLDDRRARHAVPRGWITGCNAGNLSRRAARNAAQVPCHKASSSAPWGRGQLSRMTVMTRSHRAASSNSSRLATRAGCDARVCGAAHPGRSLSDHLDGEHLPRQSLNRHKWSRRVRCIARQVICFPRLDTANFLATRKHGCVEFLSGLGRSIGTATATCPSALPTRSRPVAAARAPIALDFAFAFRIPIGSCPSHGSAFLHLTIDHRGLVEAMLTSFAAEPPLKFRSPRLPPAPPLKRTQRTVNRAPRALSCSCADTC